MSGTEPAGDNRAANLAWKRKEGLTPPIAAIPAAPAGMAVILFDRRECEYTLYRTDKESEAGANARRLFGVRGDRPRFETRPQSSPRYRRS